MSNKRKLLTGKICLVTGATSGIGEETAIGLAQAGGRVVIVGRNPEKTAVTISKIKTRTGNDSAEAMIADLTRQTDIQKLAKEFKEKYSLLHVLVNDAGGFFLRRKESADGIEMTLALNHLAGFLLTNLLLETLEKSAPSRIINVSSESHQGAHLNLDDLQGTKKYSGFRVYGETKLANVYFTYELARRLQGKGITVNTLHPGFVKTHIGRNNRGGILFTIAASLFGISPAAGARTSIYLATSPEVEAVTGHYFIKCKPVPSSAVSYNKEIARKLWEISEKLTGLPSK